jgi:hypothetical protein
VENLREASSNIISRIELPESIVGEIPFASHSEKLIPMITLIARAYDTVCNHMKQVFLPRFKSSDIFFRMMADLALSKRDDEDILLAIGSENAIPLPRSENFSHQTTSSRAHQNAAELNLSEVQSESLPVDKSISQRCLGDSKNQEVENLLDSGSKNIFSDAFAAVEEALKSIGNSNLEDQKNSEFVSASSTDREIKEDVSSTTAFSESESDTAYSSTSFVDAPEKFSTDNAARRSANSLKSSDDMTGTPKSGGASVSIRIIKINEEISRIENQERVLELYVQKNVDSAYSREQSVVQKMKWQLEREKRALQFQKTCLLLEV